MSESTDLRRGYEEPCWVCGSSPNYHHEKSDPLNVAIAELVKKFKDIKCPVEVLYTINSDLIACWEKKSVLGRDPRWTITLNNKFFWEAPLDHKLDLVRVIEQFAERIVRAKEDFIPKVDAALETLKKFTNT